MADLRPYHFKPERIPDPEDSESENEEVNDRLEGTFWCTCERGEFIPTQRGCVCCHEQPEAANEVEGRILKACTAFVAVTGKPIFFANCFRYYTVKGILIKP